MGIGPIFTLDARGHVFLEVAKAYFNLNEKQILHLIRDAFDGLKEALAIKNIEYSDLKSALIPSAKRNEIVFVFDTSRIEAEWYGLEVFRKILPLFDRESNHSVLTGDLLGENQVQSQLRDCLKNDLAAVREYEFHHSTQFYLVHINNLSDRMSCSFRNGLIDYEPFIGTLDFNTLTYLKFQVSFTLPSSFIKNRNVIIQPHPDDLDDSENENTCGYPFEEFGFELRSLKSLYYGLFLSYKIERPIIPGETDNLFALNAISEEPVVFADCDIQLDEDKLDYLKAAKGESLKRAGFENLSAKEIEKAIREKLNGNYLFNLEFNDQYDVVKFNILLEIKSPQTEDFIKLLLALEYLADDKTLRVITMY